MHLLSKSPSMMISSVLQLSTVLKMSVFPSSLGSPLNSVFCREIRDTFPFSLYLIILLLQKIFCFVLTVLEISWSA